MLHSIFLRNCHIDLQPFFRILDHADLHLFQCDDQGNILLATGSLNGNIVGSTPTKSEFEALQTRYIINNSIIDSYLSHFQDVSGWIRTQPGYLPEPEPEPQPLSETILATFRMANQPGNNEDMNIAEFKVEIDGVDITNTLTNKLLL